MLCEQSVIGILYLDEKDRGHCSFVFFVESLAFLRILRLKSDFNLKISEFRDKTPILILVF